MQIKYGDKVVTKLSERPYLVSLALTISILIYLSTMSYLTNVPYAEKLDEFYWQTITPGSTANILNTISFIVRMDLCLFFIACRVYE